jgi:arginine exporter protein ArgO
MIKLVKNQFLNSVLIFGPAGLTLFAMSSGKLSFVLGAVFISVLHLAILVYFRFFKSPKLEINRGRKSLYISLAIILVMGGIAFMLRV